MAGRPWTRKEEERAARMRRCGVPAGMIALRLGRSVRAVYQRLVDIGAREKRRPGAARDVILAMAAKGCYDWEIALELGCSVSNVAQMRRRLGVKAGDRAKSLGALRRWAKHKESNRAG